MMQAADWVVSFGNGEVLVYESDFVQPLSPAARYCHIRAMRLMNNQPLRTEGDYIEYVTHFVAVKAVAMATLVRMDWTKVKSFYYEYPTPPPAPATPPR